MIFFYVVEFYGIEYLSLRKKVIKNENILCIVLYSCFNMKSAGTAVEGKLILPSIMNTALISMASNPFGSVIFFRMSWFSFCFRIRF